MYGSKEISKAALRLAITETREEEEQLVKELGKKEILAVATDFGGNYLNSVNKLIERAIVSSKRAGIIAHSHYEEGTVAGATREALFRLTEMASGFNVGGKLGIVRYKEHLVVAVFMSIGVVFLDEVAVGMAHRTIYFGGGDDANRN